MTQRWTPRRSPLGIVLWMVACGPGHEATEDATSGSTDSATSGTTLHAGSGDSSGDTAGTSGSSSSDGGSDGGTTGRPGTDSSGTSITMRSVRGLGDLAGGEVYSRAAAISADGTTVVGGSCIGFSASDYVHYCLTEGFRWTEEDGQMQGLGSLPGWHGSGAFDVSDDGSVIVGAVGDLMPLFSPPFLNDLVVYPSRGMRWTADEGLESLGVDFTDGPSNIALAVTDDASVIAGFDTTDLGFFTESIAIREGVVEFLGGLPGNTVPFSLESFAHNVSADGSVIVGTSSGTVDGVPGRRHAFRWHGGTFTALGVPAGWEGTDARAASADGSVIVGYARREQPTEIAAFRWEAGAGAAGGNFTELGDLPGGDLNGAALGVSRDGSLVVGLGVDEEGLKAMIWDEANGMRDLNDVLAEAHDFDLGGWVLQSVADVAADNRTIVGYGINPNGDTEAWLVELP